MLPVDELPFCLRILLEQCVRKCDGFQVTESDVCNIVHWRSRVNTTVPFCPARVIFQDFTYVAENIITIIIVQCIFMYIKYLVISYTLFTSDNRYAIARICHANFVCLSVGPSVRPSHV